MHKIDLNKGWQFCRKNDKNSKLINLPHDAMIHEKRSPDNKSGSAGAYFPGGTYIYEKTFYAPSKWQNMHAYIEFEGIYKNSKVYINNQLAGERPYGYIGFFIPVENLLKYDAQNTIRVVAENVNHPDSRWYSGSGIYRPVWLYVASQLHIKPEGVKISTISYSPAIINVKTEAIGGEAIVEILDNEKIIASGNGNDIELTIKDAKLWSDETPYLYQCRVTLSENRVICDEVIETFGIRMVEWSKKGLLINGKSTLLRGGCIHHDNGILGACAYAESEERRVKILKQIGFNAIRSSHNPTSKAMLAACDKYGMYMIDETWDMWYNHKSRFDYATDFMKWYKIDIKSMVERDYNHPSIIMYSIGNEVSEPYQEKGVALTKEMVDYIHTLDKNRAVTAGINLFIIHRASKGQGIYKEDGGMKAEKKQSASGSLFFNILASKMGSSMNKMANSPKADMITSPCLDALDIAGYNYASGRYPLEGNVHPERVIFGAETFPQDIHKNWEMVEKYPYLVGDFMWTSWDYLGEAGIGAWTYEKDAKSFNKPYPWIVAGSGAVDIIGDVGAAAEYAATVWGFRNNPYIGVSPVNHAKDKLTKAVWRGTNALSSWSWKNCDGNKAIVEVYSDNSFVELLLNNKSIGRKKVKACKAVFKTHYISGTLTAIAYDGSGREKGRSELSSALGQLKILVKPEKSNVKADEIVYVNVSIVGDNNIVESNSDELLNIKVHGGELLAFGSANPRTEQQYDSGRFTTYYGRALAVVRSEKIGEMTVQVSGKGLKTVTAVIAVKDL